ncbi:MAG: O-antigen ligase family protein [Fusobacteriaceae bacterium]
MTEKINEDLIFKYGTYILFPLFIMYPSIHSEMFIFYLLLSLIKIKKVGYKKSGFELYIGLAILGLGISFLGNWHTKILKQVFSIAKILVLPIFMFQFNPIEDLEKKLFYLFNILGIYGLLEFLVIKSKPLHPGSDRYYSFLKFFMDSSVVALTGYIYCFVFLIKKRNKNILEKLLSVTGILSFTYLILLHQVRATYISFLFINFIIFAYYFTKLNIKYKVTIISSILILMMLNYQKINEVTNINNRYIQRIKSIGDTKNNHSNIARLYFWKVAVETFSKSPLNGIGYRRFNMNNIEVEPQYKNEFYHAHNEFFSMIAEVGIIGTILWYTLKMKIIYSCYIKRKKILGVFLFITFIGFEIQTFFEVYLVGKNTYRYLFVLFGLILSYLEQNENPFDDK